MSEDSREDRSNVDVGSAVVVEKEDLKDKEGKVMDEAQSLSGVRISGDDNATSSGQAIGTVRGSVHSTPPRPVKSMDIVDASPSSKSSVRPTRRSPRIAARSAPAGVVGSSASPSPKKRVLRVPISAGSGDSDRKHSVTPEALPGKDTPKAGFYMGRRKKRGDTDDVHVNIVARKDEDARDGDKKAPKRLLEEEKTGEDPDKGRLEYDHKQKQERGQEEGNNLGVEDSVVAPERLVEGGEAEKDPQGEEKGAVGDDEDTVEEEELGEHDDTTDGGETELEEEEKEEEEDDDATDVELGMEEEESGTGGGGEGVEDEEGGAEEDVMLGDDCLDRGEGDTAQERARGKRKSHEESDDQEDDVKGKDNDQEGKDDNYEEEGKDEDQEEEEDDEERKDYDQEGKDEDQEEEEDDEERKDYDQEGKDDNYEEEGKDEDQEEEEEDDEERKDYDQEEEEEEEEVDIDAMINLASSAVKSQISEPTEGSSSGGVAGGKRPASTAAADGKLRPRKIRRGGAIKSLDSKLSSPKGLLNAESKKKRESLPAFVSPKAVDGKVENLYAGSDLYSGRDRATLLKKTKTPKDETAGKGWFNMEQAEMTPELKRDLQVIRMRNYLDPKRFYKSSDKTSKFVQVGTVKESPGEFFSSRMTKKERKKTLVDELVVADDNFRTYAKNKYKSIQEKNRAGGKAHYKKLSQKRTKSPKWKL